jgi:hypothetical protein
LISCPCIDARMLFWSLGHGVLPAKVSLHAMPVHAQRRRLWLVPRIGCF